jgi:CheY-like chemotaxis protein
MMGRGEGHQYKRPDYHSQYALFETPRNSQPSVLIVDDDVESAQLMKHMFDELGFHTDLALSADEAYKMACSSQPDLVILDWILGVNTTGEDVLKRLKETFGKFRSSLSEESPKHLDIVTFSQVKAGEIKIPQSQCFRHLEHWRKPMGYRALVDRALQLLDRMEI